MLFPIVVQLVPAGGVPVTALARYPLGLCNAVAAQNFSFEEHLCSATAGAAGDLQTGVREIDQF